jgi:hypothetical protein
MRRQEDAVPDVKDARHECGQGHRRQKVVKPEEAVTFSQCAATHIFEVAGVVEQPSPASGADPVADN